MTLKQTTTTRSRGREDHEECVKVEVVYEDLLNGNEQEVIGY
jgi:hypothetical protein